MMDADLDPFDDLSSMPAAARPGKKFQPKSKARPKTTVSAVPDSNEGKFSLLIADRLETTIQNFTQDKLPEGNGASLKSLNSCAPEELVVSSEVGHSETFLFSEASVTDNNHHSEFEISTRKVETSAVAFLGTVTVQSMENVDDAMIPSSDSCLDNSKVTGLEEQVVNASLSFGEKRSSEFWNHSLDLHAPMQNVVSDSQPQECSVPGNSGDHRSSFQPDAEEVNGNRFPHLTFEGPANADMLLGLEYLDMQTASKSQQEVYPNALLQNELLKNNSTNQEGPLKMPDAYGSNVDEAIGDVEDGRLESEFEQAVHFDTDYMDEGSIPAVQSDDVFNHMADDAINHADNLHPVTLDRGDDVHSMSDHEVIGKVPALNRKGKTRGVHDIQEAVHQSSASCDVNGKGKFSMQLRKCKTSQKLINDTVAENPRAGLNSEASGDYVMNGNQENDDEFTVEDSSCSKRALRKNRSNEESAQKRKNANEVQNQISEQPHKKFSHTTRGRRRRVVDKVLLETPEDELDPRKLRIKDLILLAEFRERTSKKEGATSGAKENDHSAEKFSHWNASYDEQERFTSEPRTGEDDDEEEEDNEVTENGNYFNYHSFMNKPARMKWSKQDTQLFYEGIRQFGTDFSMIQQLFPGCSRHQIKLKFKKEERQHPLRLAEAVANRAKGHSHFELVIERLKAAAGQEEQELSGDGSVDPEGRKDEEAVVLDPDGEPSSKLEENEAVGEEDVLHYDDEGSPQSFY